MAKKRNIYVGAFYGMNLNIEVPKELQDVPDEWFKERFTDWLRAQREYAVQSYKDELFFKEAENKKSWFKRLFK